MSLGTMGFRHPLELHELREQVATLRRELADARRALVLYHDWLDHVMRHGPDAEAPALTTDSNIEFLAQTVAAARAALSGGGKEGAMDNKGETR